MPTNRRILPPLIPASPVSSQHSSFFFTPRNQVHAPEHYFLPEQTFQSQAFHGQEAELFHSESLPLRAEISKILTAIASQENIEFLQQIHTINKNKRLTPTELNAELKKVEKKYIHQDAATPVNVSSDVIRNILHAGSSRRPAHYHMAVKDIFDLIKVNVDSYLLNKPEHKEKLQNLDKHCYQMGETTKLIEKLNGISNFPTVKLGILQSFSTKHRDTAIFADCQRICRSALHELKIAMQTSDINHVSKLEKSLGKIIFDTKRKLEDRATNIMIAETKNNQPMAKTHLVNKAIEDLNMTVIRLELQPEARLSFRSNKVSPVIEARQLETDRSRPKSR